MMIFKAKCLKVESTYIICITTVYMRMCMMQVNVLSMWVHIHCIYNVRLT